MIPGSLGIRIDKIFFSFYSKKFFETAIFSIIDIRIFGKIFFCSVNFKFGYQRGLRYTVYEGENEDNNENVIYDESLQTRIYF